MNEKELSTKEIDDLFEALDTAINEIESSDNNSK